MSGDARTAEAPSFNPEAIGALCSRCYLRGERRGSPVPTEFHRGAKVALVGEGPGVEELEEGRPFCLDVGTRVLMADLSWRPLGDIRVGDRLLTLEEEGRTGPGISKTLARRWVYADVTAVHPRRASAVRVTTGHGDLVGTPDHRVLSRSKGAVLAWRRLDELLRRRAAVNGHASRIAFVAEPWTARRGYAAGWLAGFLDGEGHVAGSQCTANERHKVIGCVGFSQNLGPTLEHAEGAITALGFRMRVRDEQRAYHGRTTIARRHIMGGFVESMRFLGMVRPERLIANFRDAVEHRPVTSRMLGAAEVFSRVGVGERDVVDISTTAGTFIAEGFVVHNCGPSGRELMIALGSLGIRRDACTVTNAFLCSLPPAKDNAMGRLLSQMAAENKKRVAAGLLPWLSPVEACRPRLMREIGGYGEVLTVGKWGLRAVTGQVHSIMDVRGAPMTGAVDGAGRWLDAAALDPTPQDLARGRFVRLMPTVHPAFVLRQQRWRRVFRADIARAFQWFRGDLGWKEPTVINAVRLSTGEYQWRTPAYGEVRDFLSSGAPFFAYDLETDAKEPLVARIRCIGIGTPEAVVVIPFRTCEFELFEAGGPKSKTQFVNLKDKRFYESEDAEAAMRDLVCRFLADRRILKVGHNAGYYDRIVCEAQWGVTPEPIVDTIVLHRSVDSEMPHGLAFVGPMFTPVARAWKASHAATTANRDEDLWPYNAMDTVVTARIAEPLGQAIRARSQEHLAPIDHRLQAICAGLHRNGLYVNQATRRRLDEEYRLEALAARDELRQIVGDRGFNPNSVAAVKDVLFGEFALPPQKLTQLGEPSTDAETLKLLLLMRLPPMQRDFVKAERRFRRAVKFRGTFIRPLRPFDEPAFEDELAVDVATEEGAALQDEVAEAKEDVLAELSPKRPRKLLDIAPGLVLADGRVHPQWNSHVATTGRFSSSDPNAQNIVDLLREMYEAEEGRLYAYADYDQLELRVSSALAGDAAYLEAFHDPKGDPHSVTAGSLYGSVWKHGSQDARKRMRDFAKRFVYQCVVRGSKVATLDACGWRRIEDCEPGDWTYSWDGERCAPARIIAARCTGEREVFRLTCFDGVGREKFVEATGDHRFLMRDGRYKRLDALVPGDRLMPFRRWDTVNGYRMLDATNNQTPIYEHRLVVPGAAVVHHKDHDGRNNTPENLIAFGSHASHLVAEHEPPSWTDERRAKARETMRVANDIASFRELAAEGRRRSEKWLAAVRASRAKAVETRRARRAWNRRDENHKVRRVERAGAREVWDLTVDHPAHNFALYDSVFVANCVYMAKIPTIHRSMSMVEDKKGNLLFPTVTMKETGVLYDRWLKDHPAFPRWWERVLADFRRDGFIAEPTEGRRRYFLDGEDESAEVNFPVQAGGASALHRATIQLVEGPLSFERWGPGTGLVQQGHDALMFEVPSKLAEAACGWIKEAMTMKLPGYDVMLTCKPKFARRWDLL